MGILDNQPPGYFLSEEKLLYKCWFDVEGHTPCPAPDPYTTAQIVANIVLNPLNCPMCGSKWAGQEACGDHELYCSCGFAIMPSEMKP